MRRLLAGSFATWLIMTVAGCGEVESGVVDAASVDAPPPPTGLVCGQAAGELACNTFEGEDPAWQTWTIGGVAVLDTSDSAAGASSLRSAVAAGGSKAAQVHSVGTADRHYMRFHAKVPGDRNLSGVSLLRLGESVSPYRGVNIDLNEGNLGLAITTAERFIHPIAMPVDRWICLELEVLASDIGGRVVMRVDGTTIIDESPLDTRPEGGVDIVELGLSYVDPAALDDSVALVDDFILASEPVAACP